MGQQNFSEIFRISSSLIPWLIVGFLFFVGGLFAGIFLLFYLSDFFWIWVPAIIGYCFFINLCVEAWKLRNDYVIVNNAGIALHSTDSQKGFINWRDITEIKENNIFDRLFVKDKYGKIIRIDYAFEDFTKLINILTENIPQLTNKYEKFEKFRRTNHLHLFFMATLIIILGLTIFSVYSKYYIGGVVFGLYSYFIIYRLLVEFIAIRVNKKSIFIIYPIWKKEIKFSQIKDATIEHIRGKNGKSSPFVLLKLMDDKTIKLNAVRSGTIALYSAVKYNLLINTS